MKTHFLRSFGIFLSFVLCSLFFIACENRKISKDEEEIIESVPEADTTASETESKYDYVISNIPIPFEILDKLFRTGVKFNKELTNSTENVSKYLQTNSKALNLGIYGADLTYVISFEQFNELSGYLKKAKKLADELGIPLAFNKDALEKYERSRNNRDTLQNMLYTSYHEVDKSLKSGERLGLAALVVTGGWIEGLHLALQTLKNTEDEAAIRQLNKIIRQQQFNLDNIISLLKEFKEDKYFESLAGKLVDIQHIYDFMDKKNIAKAETAAITEKIYKLRKEITEASSF